MATQRPRDTRAESRWFLAGYVGLVGFLALEATVRQRGSAASLCASDDDEGTTRGIVTAFVLGATLPPLLRRSGSLPVVAVVSSVLGRAYGRRITAEERLLARDLPDYPAYQGRTRRLLPFVW